MDGVSPSGAISTVVLLDLRGQRSIAAGGPACRDRDGEYLSDFCRTYRPYLSPGEKNGICLCLLKCVLIPMQFFCKLRVDRGSAKLVCCMLGCIVSFICAGKYTERPGKHSQTRVGLMHT